jgi:hypothetical protein
MQLAHVLLDPTGLNGRERAHILSIPITSIKRDTESGDTIRERMVHQHLHKWDFDGNPVESGGRYCIVF